jgi:hypothetical protein
MDPQEFRSKCRLKGFVFGFHPLNYDAFNRGLAGGLTLSIGQSAQSCSGIFEKLCSILFKAKYVQMGLEKST